MNLRYTYNIIKKIIFDSYLDLKRFNIKFNSSKRNEIVKKVLFYKLSV